jgi:hypothetical protein
MSPEDRAAMLTVMTGVNKRFDRLSAEQKDIVFGEMLDVRRKNVIYNWMIANCDARIIGERGPKALARALQTILSLRDTNVITAAQRKMPGDILWKTRPFLEMAEEMLEALLDDDAEDRHNPSESEMAAQAQYEEVKRMRDVLAKFGVRSHLLIGRMVGFTSGRKIGAYAVKERFAKQRRQKIKIPI